MTLGKKLLEIYEKNSNTPGPEAREITLEFGKKDFLPRLERIAREESVKYQGKFYIQIFGYTDPHNAAIGHIKYIIRATRPNPEPKCMLYSYNKDKDEWKYEWMLPAESSFKKILENHEGFHSHIVENIAKFKKGTLK